MYQCSLIPYAVCSALRTEHVRSLRIGISLKMAKYPVKSTSQSTYGRMETVSWLAKLFWLGAVKIQFFLLPLSWVIYYWAVLYSFSSILTQIISFCLKHYQISDVDPVKLVSGVVTINSCCLYANSFPLHSLHWCVSMTCKLPLKTHFIVVNQCWVWLKWLIIRFFFTWKSKWITLNFSVI